MDRTSEMGIGSSGGPGPWRDSLAFGVNRWAMNVVRLRSAATLGGVQLVAGPTERAALLVRRIMDLRAARSVDRGAPNSRKA